MCADACWAFGQLACAQRVETAAESVNFQVSFSAEAACADACLALLLGAAGSCQTVLVCWLVPAWSVGSVAESMTLYILVRAFPMSLEGTAVAASSSSATFAPSPRLQATGMTQRH